jgi:class 3 adenylate cyclase
LADDESFVRSMKMIMRASASPGSAAEFARTAAEADIGEVLPAIRVPTLLLYRKDPAAVEANTLGMRAPQQSATEMAAVIPNARAVGLDGQDLAPFVGDEIVTEVEKFLRAPLTEPLPDRVLATVLFTDLVGSTERAAALGDAAWRGLLSSHRADVRRELGRFGGVELDTAGDGFFASFDGPARAIGCAQAIIGSGRERDLDIRAGIHTGECEREDGKLTGIAVHTGARICALAKAGEVLVSRTVKDLVAGSEIGFDDRGEHHLKGVPAQWQLYAAHAEAL